MYLFNSFIYPLLFVIVPLLLIVSYIFVLFHIKQAAKVKYITLFHCSKFSGLFSI